MKKLHLMVYDARCRTLRQLWTQSSHHRVDFRVYLGFNWEISAARFVRCHLIVPAPNSHVYFRLRVQVSNTSREPRSDSEWGPCRLNLFSGSYGLPGVFYFLFPFSLCVTWNDFLSLPEMSPVHGALYGIPRYCTPSYYITPTRHATNSRFIHHSILKSTLPPSNERGTLFSKGIDFEQTPVLTSLTFRF